MRTRAGGTAQALQDFSLFSFCTKEELRHIAALCTPLRVGEGCVLARRGGAATECFVIGEGTALVVADDHIVAAVGPGDCVGEMELLDGGPRSRTVVALTAMTLYVFAQEEFNVLLHRHPAVTRKVAMSLARRLRVAEGDAIRQLPESGKLDRV